MRLNKKGALIYELLIGFTLVSFITVFLLNIALNFRSANNRQKLITELTLNKASLTKMINDDLMNDTLIGLRKDSDYNYTFIFQNLGEKKLSVNSSEKTITYGNYKKKLPDNYIMEVSPSFITKTNFSSVPLNKNDSYIIIYIGIKTSSLTDDFGIRILYQYNSRINNLLY